MSITELYELFIHHPKVTTDSRNCPKGSIFFALKGENFDGNEYASKALAVGSSYAVIDNPDYYTGERTILVENVLKTLQQLAQRHRKVIGIPVIAITGTNGKTTTKELLANVLSTKFNLLYTEGNLNNHIGVPLTLLRLNHEHEMAVIEMGASKPGDIKELAEVTMPNYGVITNVGQGHLEGFGSFEKVVQTKGELYDYIRRTKGIIFIKKGNEYLEPLGKGIQQIKYGTGDDTFASGCVTECNPYVVFNWKQQGKLHTVETQLIGDYNLDNLLIAVTIGRYFKIPAERISRTIAAYQPTNKRSQFQETDSNELIIDTYNANPVSMKAALNNLSALKTTRPKAVILGDMLELGVESESLHIQVIEQLNSLSLDKVYLCGEQFGKVAGSYPHFSSTEDLKEELKRQPVKGCLVLIKGSRGIALEKVIDLL